MVESAAHLVDHVLPKQPIRQMVSHLRWGSDAAGDDSVEATDSADTYADQSDDGRHADQTIYTDNG